MHRMNAARRSEVRRMLILRSHVVGTQVVHARIFDGGDPTPDVLRASGGRSAWRPGRPATQGLFYRPAPCAGASAAPAPRPPPWPVRIGLPGKSLGYSACMFEYTDW